MQLKVTLETYEYISYDVNVDLACQVSVCAVYGLGIDGCCVVTDEQFTNVFDIWSLMPCVIVASLCVRICWVVVCVDSFVSAALNCWSSHEFWLIKCIHNCKIMLFDLSGCIVWSICSRNIGSWLQFITGGHLRIIILCFVTFGMCMPSYYGSTRKAIVN